MFIYWSIWIFLLLFLLVSIQQFDLYFSVHRYNYIYLQAFTNCYTLYNVKISFKTVRWNSIIICMSLSSRDNTRHLFPGKWRCRNTATTLITAKVSVTSRAYWFRDEYLIQYSSVAAATTGSRIARMLRFLLVLLVTRLRSYAASRHDRGSRMQYCIVLCVHLLPGSFVVLISVN